MEKYILNKSVTIYQVLRNSAFTVANNKIFSITNYNMTANKRAETILLSNSEFLNAIMPTIVGADKLSPEWRQLVRKHLYELDVVIDSTQGKVLDISFIYEYDNIEYAENISILEKDLTLKKAKKSDKEPKEFKFKDSQELGEYVDENIAPIDRHRYGRPVNYEHYFLYIYCLESSRVANSKEESIKSLKILYYLVTKEDVEKAKLKLHNTGKKLRKYLTQLDDSETLFNNVCTMLEIKGDNKITKFANVEIEANANPEKFIAIIEDTKLQDKCKIQGYIDAGLLFKTGISGIITDMSDRSKIIGNNLNEAITFFSNPLNKDYIDTLNAEYKMIEKTIKKENQ